MSAKRGPAGAKAVAELAKSVSKEIDHGMVVIVVADVDVEDVLTGTIVLFLFFVAIKTNHFHSIPYHTLFDGCEPHTGILSTAPYYHRNH